MKVGILFSGGKDSVFALSWALQQSWDVCCLMTIKSKNEDSYMFHTPNIDLVDLQAESLGIPLITQETMGKKEKELEDLKQLFLSAKSDYGIEGVIVGALWSDYQQERVNRICFDVDLKTYAPLWHKDQLLLLQEMIDSNFDIRISSFSAEGLSKEWLGQRIDNCRLKKLKKLRDTLGFHPAGEGGEYESFVVDGPIFKKKLIVEGKQVMEGENRGKFIILKSILS